MPIVKKDNLYSQNSNYGIGHMSGGEIKDKAKVAGEIEENNNNQSQNIDIKVDVNLASETNSNSSENSLNDSQKAKYLFEIKISGELTQDKKAKYNDVN